MSGAIDSGSRVQIVFLPCLPTVAAVRIPGWVVLALPEGIGFMCALTASRALLSDGERDQVRAAFNVAPLAADPSKRAWVAADLPDVMCPCVIPVQIRAIRPWWNDCVMHAGEMERVSII